jgi:hypothetical protein
LIGAWLADAENSRALPVDYGGKHKAASESAEVGRRESPEPHLGHRMAQQFIRILREGEDKEILININSISKIEVQYMMKATQPGEVACTCSLRQGLSDPDAIRIYTLFAAGEKVSLTAKPGSKVMRMLEEIYKNAILDE